MPFDITDAKDIALNHEARLKAIEDLLDRVLKPQDEPRVDARPNKIQPRMNEQEVYENEVSKEAMTLERVPESQHPPVSREPVIPQRPPKPVLSKKVDLEEVEYQGQDDDQDEPIDFPEPPRPVSRPVPVQPPRVMTKPQAPSPEQWLRKPRPQL